MASRSKIYDISLSVDRGVSPQDCLTPPTGYHWPTVGGARDGAALLPAESNDETQRLHALLARAREGRPDRGPPLRVLVQGSAEAPRFYGRLLGDGYEPFTLAMHATRVKPKL